MINIHAELQRSGFSNQPWLRMSTFPQSDMPNLFVFSAGGALAQLKPGCHNKIQRLGDGSLGKNHVAP